MNIKFTPALHDSVELMYCCQVLETVTFEAIEGARNFHIVHAKLVAANPLIPLGGLLANVDARADACASLFCSN